MRNTMKKTKRCLPIFVMVCLMSFVNGTKEYKISLTKDKPSIELRWNIDYKQAVVNFILEISVLPKQKPCTTMAVLGFSDRGYVTDADIVIMRYDDESVDIEDSWSDEAGRINMDNQQDYHLADYDVKSNHVSIAFNRKINTKDYYDYLFDNGTVNLFHFLQIPDNTAIATSHGATHGSVEDLLKKSSPPALNAKEFKTEMTSIQVLKPDIPASYFGNETNLTFFSILQPNIPLPAQVTTYWCSTRKLPSSIQTKIHAIGFGGNITQKNGDVVHHITVFLCDPEDGDVTMYNGVCDNVNEPADVRRCNRVVGAWAKGAEDLFYPNEAGVPFGDNAESRYFRLEIHYHNPEKKAGLIDSSGMNFYYSDSLREYDAGVLEIGITYNENLAIPPRNEHFVLKGYCPGACTMEALDDKGINVFASQLHTHLAGRSVRISHYRGVNRLPDLNRDDHYQTMFQEIRQIYPPVKVIQGDSLVTSCTYNTMDRSNVTTTGDSLFQEMCISYLHYYPRSSLEVCKSSTSTQALGEFFLLQKLLTGRPRKIDFFDLSDNYKNLQWNPELTTELQMTYQHAALDVECRKHNGDQLPGKWKDEYFL